MKTEKEKTHAKFSPSSAKRWMNCPGSIKLSMNAPKQPDSPYAKEGTDAHRCLELLLKYPSSEKRLRKEYPKEMVNHAVWAVKEINKLAPVGANLLIETKVSNHFVDEDFYGTLDVAIVEEFGDLTVIDYKYGAGIAVDPELNPQLIAYALGLAHEYDYNFGKVNLIIIQPRAHHKHGPIRATQMQMDDIRVDWRNLFTHRVQLAKAKNPPLSSGEWCRFCPAAMNCPEISDSALKSAQVDFDMTTSEITYPDQKSLSNESLSVTLRAMDKIEFWIEQTRAYAFNLLNSGGKIAGYKLVPKRAQRKWIDEEKVQKEAVKHFGNKVFEIAFKSPAQLEKITPKGWVDARCTQVSSGLTMVRGEDLREGVDQIQIDFAPLKTEKQKQIKTTTKTKGKK